MAQCRHVNDDNGSNNERLGPRNSLPASLQFLSFFERGVGDRTTIASRKFAYQEARNVCIWASRESALTVLSEFTSEVQIGWICFRVYPTRGQRLFREHGDFSKNTFVLQRRRLGYRNVHRRGFAYYFGNNKARSIRSTSLLGPRGMNTITVSVVNFSTQFRVQLEQ